MAYRDDVTALEARHAALDDEVNRQTVERDRARTLLDDAKARLRLPILDDVRVASPCTVDWETMVGDEQVRHCGVCDKNVFNLSGMTREDAEAVIVAANGKLCVRYYRRADGTILSGDCPVGQRRVRRRKLIVAGATVLVVATAALTYALARPGLGEVGEPQRVTQRPMEVMQGGSAAAMPMPAPQAVHEVKGEVKGDMDREAPAAIMGQMAAPIAPAKPSVPSHKPAARMRHAP